MNTREYDPTRPLPSLEQRAFEKHLSVESLYMPAGDYEQSNNSILRRNAIHFICKVSHNIYTSALISLYCPFGNAENARKIKVSSIMRIFSIYNILICSFSH